MFVEHLGICINIHLAGQSAGFRMAEILEKQL